VANWASCGKIEHISSNSISHRRSYANPIP
jgi:hypothetical protein